MYKNYLVTTLSAATPGLPKAPTWQKSKTSRRLGSDSERGKAKAFEVFFICLTMCVDRSAAGAD